MLFDDDIDNNNADEDDDDFFEITDDKNADKNNQSTERFIDASLSDKIIGHSDIETTLYNLVTSDRPPQAFLFNGALGVGKATMAYRVARFLLKPREDTLSLFGDVAPPEKNFNISKEDPTFRLVASNGHPDLLTISRPVDEKTGTLKQSVLVDDLRKIQPFLRLTPSVENGYRIVIIDDADTMTSSSQNALLKILEEPPARALIILNTHKLSSIIPTILSRVQVINFPNLSDDVIKDTLQTHFTHLSKQHINDIIMMAEGSIGRALSYTKPEALLLLDSISEILSSLPRIEWSKVQTLAGILGVKESQDSLKIFYERIIHHIRAQIKDIMLSAPHNSEPYFQALNRIQTSYRKAIASNLDKKLVIFEIFDVLEHLSTVTTLPNAA